VLHAAAEQSADDSTAAAISGVVEQLSDQGAMELLKTAGSGRGF